MFDPHDILSRALPDDWRTVFEEIDLLARELRWQDLGTLRAAAGERLGQAAASIRDRIENWAAAHEDGARALAGWMGSESGGRTGEIADRLAQSHGWAAIAAMGFRDDVLVRAAHARVLRREDLSADAAAREVAGRTGTDASWLAPHPLERAASLPAYTPGGSTRSLPFGDPGGDTFQPTVRRDLTLSVRQVPPAQLPAFAAWHAVHAAVAIPGSQATPAHAAGAFSVLLPDASQDDTSFRIREVGASESWALLLGAAFSGSSGVPACSADARIQAWTTLAALLMLPSPLPLDAIGAAATDARWFLLRTQSSSWFRGTGYDAALVVSGRNHWGALAATD